MPRLLVAVLLLLGVAAPMARADDAAISASTSSPTYTPNTATVFVGNTLTVSRGAAAGLSHNVHYSDQATGCPTLPTASAWTCSRTFDTAGDYTFHCDLHGLSMSATVHV